jgi:hypothetical protein
MSGTGFTPEQLALKSLAQTVCKRRCIAKGGQPFSEPSVTQLILQDIKAIYPGTVQVVQFPPKTEGKNGSDWAWVFEDAKSQAFMPMYVQAKALDLNDIHYSGIKQLVGKPQDGMPPPPRQIDVFISAADADHWPAIYAFYNHLDNPKRIPQRCHTMSQSPTGLIPDTWGISIADARRVRAKLDDQSFDTLRHLSRPLHCLLCSSGSGHRGYAGSPTLALEALKNLQQAAPDGREPMDASVTLSEPLRELPDLFRKALEAQGRAERRRRALLDELADEHPRLEGVVVLRDGFPD